MFDFATLILHSGFPVVESGVKATFGAKMKSHLAQLVKSFALETRADNDLIRLSSGRLSRYYIDGKRLSLHSETMHECVQCLSQLIMDGCSDGIVVDAIGGPCIGSDAMVGALLYHWGGSRHIFRGFLVRKEEKKHGKPERVIGTVKPGDNCVLIEDVVTTGRSSLDAIRQVQAFGAKVHRVVCLMDREEGADELLANEGIDLKAALTMKDLGLPPDVGARNA